MTPNPEKPAPTSRPDSGGDCDRRAVEAAVGLTGLERAHGGKARRGVLIAFTPGSEIRRLSGRRLYRGGGMARIYQA